MTKKNKNLITFLIPIILFSFFGISVYLLGNEYEKSFVELDSLKKSKIELKNQNYNLYSLDSDVNDKKKSLSSEIEIFENKTKDTLNINLKDKNDYEMFISTSRTTSINNKVYKFITKFKISNNGIYHLSINNNLNRKIKFVIQTENDDKYYFKSILICYLLSIIGLILLILKLISKIINYLKK